MHFSNPFTNPPRLPSPSKRRASHNRSPSHSPERYRAKDNDPLLRDLSPTSTLRAFVTDPNEWTETTSNALARSILTSSHSERALGAKAAKICLDVRSWTREMEHWQWPGTFEVVGAAGRRVRTSTMSFGTLASVIPDEDEEEYWGSLPAKVVQAYSKRADEIGQALDQIDVEELKDYVLSSHYRTGGRTAERGKRADIKKLDDYTAVITATILQALPYLSKLNRLLDTWTIRLMILQSAFTFVRDLQRARMDMDHGWAAIAVSTGSGANSSSASFSREAMLEMKNLIEHQVASLGRRLDRFLDDLEGREETVPDTWIEDFERLETAYGGWVVQAERKVLENEWRGTQQDQPPQGRAVESDDVRNVQQGEPDVSHTEDPESDGEAVVRPLIDQKFDDRRGPDLKANGTIKPLRRSKTDAEVNGLEKGWQIDNLFPRKSLSEERKSRNVPFVATADASGATPSVGRSISQGSAQNTSDLTDENGPKPLPKERTAFLNKVDRTNTLMKQSKSPVRSFEHASNAFTRLFKKGKSSEQGKQTSSSPENNKNGTHSPNDDEAPTRGRKSFLSGLNATSRSAFTASQGSKARESSRVSTTHTRKNNISDTTFIDDDADLPPILMPPDDIKRRRVVPTDHQDNAANTTIRSSNLFDGWPLSAPMETPKNRSRVDPATRAMRVRSEIYTPDRTLETDAFDQMFVQNFPDSPSARPRSAREARDPGRWAEGRKRAKSMPRTKGKAPAVMSKSREKKQKAVSPLEDLQSPSYIDIPGPSASRPKPDTSREMALPSQESTPEIIHEPTYQTSDDLLLDTASTVETEIFVPETIAVLPKSSPAISEDTSNEEPDESKDAVVNDSELEKPVLLKRASITSVEAFKRADVKSIELQGTPKQESQSPISSRPQTPEVFEPPSPPTPPPAQVSPLMESPSHKLPIPTPPRKSSWGKVSPPARSQTPTSRHRYDMLSSSPQSNLRETTPDRKIAPLNAAMIKRRAKAPQRKENTVPRILTLSPSKKGAVFNPEGDTFDRHISEVLETLPSTIRFKTRAGAETPVSENGEQRNHGPPRAKNPRMVPRANVTIAPTESPPKKSGSGNDNEVKVYHLTQAGSDETIKLFVRLVGESERVMVRVGGGWADLADYLRQYADHHGSRTVSQGTLEFQPVNGTASRRVSGAAEQKGKQPVTPVSSSSKNPLADDQHWLSQPQPTFSMGDGTSSDEGGGDTDTTARPPPPPPLSSIHTTPQSSTKNGSRPSTANTERPSSRQSASDFKLSGPSSGKRGQLSEHKEKWVEGMIERAKQASAEKSKEDNQKYFAELGKAGATRRVIFRSSSAMSNRPNGGGGGDKAK